MAGGLFDEIQAGGSSSLVVIETLGTYLLILEQALDATLTVGFVGGGTISPHKACHLVGVFRC